MALVFQVSAPLSFPITILTNFSESSGWSCGKDTHVAEHMSFTQLVLDVFTGVELVSRATYISRKRRNWETRQLQSKACKRAEREAKRKLMAQPEISTEPATLSDENFVGATHVSHQLALWQGHVNVFFLQAVWRQRW